MTEEEIVIEITNHGKDIESLKRRMDGAEAIVGVVHQLAEEMVGLTKEIKFMNATITTLTAKVAEIENRPAKRWEMLVTALISAVVGAVIGYIL